MTGGPDDSMHPTAGPAPVGADRRGVSVAILTDGDPIRLCHRLQDGLEGTPWLLERALIAAEQVFPTPRTAVGAAAQVVECVLVRADGRTATADDLPAYLERLEVISVRPTGPVSSSTA